MASITANMSRPDERSDARERALYLLYEAHSKGISPSDALSLQVLEPDELTVLIVDGVEAHSSELDEAIAAKSKGWTLERMPVLDLNVLRIAAFELRERLDVPVAVVLDEAVKLAKRFSTDDSGKFVNGVLAALTAELRPAEPLR
jgi:N utilization substance protein B